MAKILSGTTTTCWKHRWHRISLNRTLMGMPHTISLRKTPERKPPINITVKSSSNSWRMRAQVVDSRIPLRRLWTINCFWVQEIARSLTRAGLWSALWSLVMHRLKVPPQLVSRRFPHRVETTTSSLTCSFRSWWQRSSTRPKDAQVGCQRSAVLN